MTTAEMLEFEAQWWRRGGAKEQAIRDRFGIEPVRYFQVLNRTLDDPEALSIDAVTVRRLQRLRAGAGRWRGTR